LRKCEPLPSHQVLGNTLDFAHILGAAIAHLIEVSVLAFVAPDNARRGFVLG
jgi:hypothetical protein